MGAHSSLGFSGSGPQHAFSHSSSDKHTHTHINTLSETTKGLCAHMHISVGRVKNVSSKISTQTHTHPPYIHTHIYI